MKKQKNKCKNCGLSKDVHKGWYEDSSILRCPNNWYKEYEEENETKK